MDQSLQKLVISTLRELILAKIKKNVHNYNVTQIKEITCSWEDKRFHRLTFEKTEWY